MRDWFHGLHQQAGSFQNPVAFRTQYAGRVDGAWTPTLRSGCKAPDGIAVLSKVDCTMQVDDDHRSIRLDGLRGIAIALVLCHSLLILDTPDDAASRFAEFILDRGWLGVQLFFVLSGFLITGILIRSRHAPNYYASFFIRRALRIFPLYYAFLLCLLLIASWLDAESPSTSRATWPYWFFLSDLYPAPHERLPHLSHLWSLAVEEQFYLTWPFILRRLSPSGSLVACATVIFLAFALRFALLACGLEPEAVYTHPLARMDALAWGASAAIALRMPIRHDIEPATLRLAALVVFLAALVATRGLGRTTLPTQTFGYSLVGLSFALWVSSAAEADARRMALPAPLVARMLAWLGRYSYATYLFQRPLHVLVGQPWLSSLGEGASHSALIALGYLVAMSAASLAMAACSYKLIEGPFLRLKDRWRPSTFGA